MKYQAKLPKGNVNVSKQSQLKEFVIMVGGAGVALVAVYWLLAVLVSFGVDYISSETEAQLHQNIRQTIDNSPEQIIAPELIDTVAQTQIDANKDGLHIAQQITQSLQQCIEIPYPITVKLLVSEEVNAFALAGGYIYLTTGLLEQLKTENALAFVLAHELTHFKNRDHLRATGRAIILVSLTSLIFNNAQDIGELISWLGGIGESQFSQQQESLADSGALTALNCHYGHVAGATELFRYLLTQDEEQILQQFFSTHPELEKRIQDIYKLTHNNRFALRKPLPKTW